MERVTRANAIRGLLSLVAAMGGQLEDRIRMQKSVYLLRALGNSDFSATYFKYHHYGPYSRSLSDILQEAIVSGLLMERRADFGDEHSKYTYELTDLGRSWLVDNTDHRWLRLSDLAQTFKAQHWRTLELAATIHFVQNDEHISERSEAMARALALKPACKEFESAASGLLRSIGL